MKFTTSTKQLYLKPLCRSAALWIILLAMAVPNRAQAAAGDLDPTFGSGGKSTVGYPLGGANIGNAVAIQPDGKIVVAGYIASGVNGNADMVVLRFNPDGNLDPSFGSGGTVFTDFFAEDDRAYAVAIQADGKIVVAGSSTQFFALVRYNPDGTDDTSFGAFGDGRVRTDVSGDGPAQVNAIAIQSDGKIVVAGRSGDSAANSLDFAILRYNEDGTLDSAFGTSGGTNVDFFSGNDAAFALVIQGDGKIVAGGSASRGDASSPDFALVRLNADGSFDASFDVDGKVATDFSSSLDGIYGIALQTNGKIVAAGFTFITSEANDNFALARYNTNGSLDTTFGTGGKVITDIHPVTDEAHAVVIQSDGKIIAGGIAGPGGNLDFALARYDSSGALDPTFGGDGTVTTVFSASDDVLNAMALQADGKVVAGGLSNSGTSFALARYLTGGAAAAPAALLNISTRMQVLTGDNVLIGGFIVTGNAPKQVIVRAIGPALTDFGVPGALMNPILELNGPNGVTTNDDWKDTQQPEIMATGLQPTKDVESAILQTLDPGAYTAIVRGVGGTTGVGLVEAYNLDAASDSKLANISTRGFIDTGDNVMIGGFIIGPDDLGDATVLVRAIGPSLENFGVANALQEPTLDLFDGNGTLLLTNDNWMDSQETEIEATGLAPTDDRESAILATLPPGGYTAIVRGAATPPASGWSRSITCNSHHECRR